MKNIKKYYLLILGLVCLLIGPFVACGQAGYTKYTNEEFGYTIDYPYNWNVEVSADGTKCLLVSQMRKASVMIDVAEAITPRVAANYLLMSIAQGTPSKEVTKLEDKPMQGDWDWYLSYDYEMEYGAFHGEAFFKVTDEHLYKLDTAADAVEYKDYPFSTIVSSFKLLR